MLPTGSQHCELMAAAAKALNLLSMQLILADEQTQDMSQLLPQYPHCLD